MLRYIDISLPLQENMVVWPGDEAFSRIEKKSTAIVSRLRFSTHTGTHIDAPRHFLFNSATVDKIPLGKLIGKCQVIEISPPAPRSEVGEIGGEKEGVGGERSKLSQLIEVSDLARFKIRAGDKILFKTRNSKLLRQKKFTSDYVSLSLEAAKYLAAKKIDLVGIDYYGIEAKSAPGHPVHKTLLRAGIVIVEGLDLSKVKAGSYHLAVLPLKISGADGSPCRAVLWRQ